MKDYIRNKLVKLGLVKSNKRKSAEKNARELREIANVLERMICSGSYRGSWMCNVLHHQAELGNITKEQHTLAKDHIECLLNGSAHLTHFLIDRSDTTTHDRDVLAGAGVGYHARVMVGLDTDKKYELQYLEIRLILTNWYWKQIRIARKLADLYENEARFIN